MKSTITLRISPSGCLIAKVFATGSAALFAALFAAQALDAGTVY